MAYATINKKNLFTKEILTKVFQNFDKDNGGSISADELKTELFKGQDINDGVWEELIR